MIRAHLPRLSDLLASKVRAMPSARALAYGRAPTGLDGYATSIPIAEKVAIGLCLAIWAFTFIAIGRL